MSLMVQWTNSLQGVQRHHKNQYTTRQMLLCITRMTEQRFAAYSTQLLQITVSYPGPFLKSKSLSMTKIRFRTGSVDNTKNWKTVYTAVATSRFMEIRPHASSFKVKPVDFTMMILRQAA